MVPKLLTAVEGLVLPFIQAADQSAALRASGSVAQAVDGLPQDVLVDLYKPDTLVDRLKLILPPGEGLGKDGLLETVRRILQHSVNTWDQGFLDKLYASNNAVGAKAGS